MRHDSLKTQIRIAQATTRIQRSEATKLIRKGRDLRKKATTETTRIKQDRLNNKGWECRSTSMDLRSAANDGRNDRRHMHLAAALLNGRAYQRAEAKCDPKNKPSASVLGAWIKPYLPKEEQTHAEYIAELWLKDGTIRLNHIEDKGLVQLLALDKQKADIEGTKRSIKLAEKALTEAQGAVTQQERWIASAQTKLADQKANAVKATAHLDGLHTQLAGQEASLRAEQDALKASKAITRCIDDLFEVA